MSKFVAFIREMLQPTREKKTRKVASKKSGRSRARKKKAA
jgi:hypothetical protein